MLEVGPEPVGVETLSHPHDGGWVALATYFLLRGTIFDFTGTGLNFADTNLARISSDRRYGDKSCHKDRMQK